MIRRPLVAGNWKMNGLRASLAEIEAMGAAYDDALRARAELIVCPPATLIAPCARDVARGRRLGLGGQDCHPAASGAHTGDISAEMLKDAGASYVIVGHSERRSDHGETERRRAREGRRRPARRAHADRLRRRDARRARGGRCAERRRRADRGISPRRGTPANIVVAYEPVWAIGTG